MKIIGDYHTHTVYSHGKGTVAQSVERASQMGLKTIAISEHGPGHAFFGVSRENLNKIKEEIDALKPLYPHMQIKFGLEANIMSPDGVIDVDQALLDSLDFVMAGYHFGSTPKRWVRDSLWHLANLLVPYLPFLKGYCIRNNTRALVKAMDRYPLFAITHPGAKGPIDIHQVAKKAFEKGVLLEINAHHGHLSVENIRVARQYQVRFIINSDAHRPEDIGRLEAGLARAQEAGLTEEDVFNATLD